MFAKPNNGYLPMVQEVAEIVTALSPTQACVERLYFALHMVKLPLLASRKENLVEPTFVFETNA